MKKIAVISVLLGHILLSGIYAQNATLELTFTGTHQNELISLDSILIENMSQGGDTTIYLPDSILVLNCITSGSSPTYNKNESLTISQNYPNPFKNSTKFDIKIFERQEINIVVTDMLGQSLVQLKTILIPGTHTYNFNPGHGKYYIVTVTGKYDRKSIKLLSLNENDYKNCELHYFSFTDKINLSKSQANINSFIFDLGNQLKYTGYITVNDSLIATDIILDTPQINKTYQFYFAALNPCPGSPEITYEGKIYSTVLIGDQCWFNENLNVGTMISGNQNQQDNNILEKYCYDDLESNCENLGALYQWNELMEYTTEEGTQGICPNGWHVPTDMEWFQMANFLDPAVSNPALQSWQGDDIGFQLTQGGSSGFEALFNGFRHWQSGEFGLIDERSHFWTSTVNPYNTIFSWYRIIEEGNPQIYKNACITDYGYAIRCVKDTTVQIPWSCGEPMIDERDDQQYNTVMIDEQCWLAENLNYGTQIDGTIDQSNNNLVEKYCYDDLESNCENLGALYQWNELMEYTTEEGAQGICPDGWHVPTDMEWFQMANYLDPAVNNPALQSWQGDDIGFQLAQGGSSGFEAIFSGQRHWQTGEFAYVEELSLFWTSTFNPYNSIFSWYRALEYGNHQIYKNASMTDYGYATRCVKDTTVQTTWSCGEPMTDERDDQQYNTVMIDAQCWLAENLNYGTQIDGINDQSNNNLVEKYCYDDLESNCENLGALYQWNELMEYTTEEGTQGICPDGWHIPTDMEWYQMANFLDPAVSNPNLQSWQGYDIGFQLAQGGSSGFEALFNGFRHWQTGEFDLIDEKSFFWTSTFNPYNSIHSWYRALEDENPQIYKNGCITDYGYATRCVKDTTVQTTWSCGEPMTDERDDQQYNTVMIDEQCWLANNLNYGIQIDGINDQSNNNMVEKYCYDDLESNCENLGALYQWNELMEYTTEEGTQGICPNGWHVPTDMEWFQMANFLDPAVSNPNLQSWQGYDIGFQLAQGGSSGFGALFNGFRHWQTGEFDLIDEKSFFWTSTFNPYNSIHSWYRALEDENPQIYKNGCITDYGYATRCIKDN